MSNQGLSSLGFPNVVGKKKKTLLQLFSGNAPARFPSKAHNSRSIMLLQVEKNGHAGN
jgi:hypothetical protein